MKSRCSKATAIRPTTSLLSFRANTSSLTGDGCDSDFQEDAGIRKADVFVAVTGRDDDNLVACEIATRVFSVNRCIARVNNPKTVESFARSASRACRPCLSRT